MGLQLSDGYPFASAYHALVPNFAEELVNEKRAGTDEAIYEEKVMKRGFSE